MPFCIGKKACARARCKNRCQSWLAGKPDLVKACKNVCKSHSGLEKEEFLCSGKYVDQHDYMLRYKTDPCPEDDIVMQQVLDPLDDRGREEREWQDLQPVLVVLGLLIVAALVILYVLKK